MKEREEKSEFRPRDRKVVGAFIASALGWALHLNVSYILVPESCGAGSKMMLHAVTVLCLAITLSAAALAWSVRASCIGEPDTVLWKQRTKFTSDLVFVLALAFSLVIVAQSIPNYILRSCD